MKMRVLVIGAGIFGLSIAYELDQIGLKVHLVEKEDDIMMKASYINHNRLHLGYHYLRSKETAKQSLDGLLSFLFYYGESIYHDFENYYAIAKKDSKTNTAEFVEFCNEIGIDYNLKFPSSFILNSDLLDSCFEVPEPIFDYDILKQITKRRLERSSIILQLNTVCEGVSLENNMVRVKLNGVISEYDFVVNCAYSNLNEINTQFNIKQRKIKYQDVYIPIFESNINPVGLTIMDGPFCSIMPKGKKKNEFLLYHVVHSVLGQAFDNLEERWNVENEIDLNKIFSESGIFFPFLSNTKRLGYNRTIRAINDNENDARISELIIHDEYPHYFTILSGKITTAVQTALTIKNIIQGKPVTIKKIL